MEWNLVEVIVETTATIRIGFDATFQHFLVIDAFDCRSRQNPQQFEIVIDLVFIMYKKTGIACQKLFSRKKAGKSGNVLIAVRIQP